MQVGPEPLIPMPEQDVVRPAVFLRHASDVASVSFLASNSWIGNPTLVLRTVPQVIDAQILAEMDSTKAQAWNFRP